MSIHHPRIGCGAPRAAQLVVRLYPRSVLWLLTTVAIVLAVQGSWVILGTMLSLFLVIAWQTVRTDHHARRRRR